MSLELGSTVGTPRQRWALSNRTGINHPFLSRRVSQHGTVKVKKRPRRMKGIDLPVSLPARVEMSGLGSTPRQRTPRHLKWSNRSPLAPLGRQVRFHTSTRRRINVHAMPNELDGLGFSLKPPKWVRKMQPGKILKKVAVPLALVGAAVLIPGAAPLLAKGVLGAGKLAFGAGKLAFGGARGLFKFAGKNIASAAGIFKGGATPQTTVSTQPDVSTIPVPTPTESPVNPTVYTTLPTYEQQVANQMAQQVAQGGSQYAAAPAAASTQQYETGATEAAPQQAGLGGGSGVALAIGAAALIGMIAMGGGRQARRS